MGARAAGQEGAVGFREGRKAVLYRLLGDFGSSDLKIDTPCLSWVRGRGCVGSEGLGGGTMGARGGLVSREFGWEVGPRVFAVCCVSLAIKSFCLSCADKQFFCNFVKFIKIIKEI
jgi:hypothetical protein